MTEIITIISSVRKSDIPFLILSLHHLSQGQDNMPLTQVNYLILQEHVEQLVTLSHIKCELNFIFLPWARSQKCAREWFIPGHIYPLCHTHLRLLFIGGTLIDIVNLGLLLGADLLESAGRFIILSLILTHHSTL
jgi:hypothetical protein